MSFPKTLYDEDGNIDVIQLDLATYLSLIRAAENFDSKDYEKLLREAGLPLYDEIVSARKKNADPRASMSDADLIAEAEDDEYLPFEFAESLVAGQKSPIALWRRYRGLTQEQVASNCGVSSNYLSMIETGARSPGLRLLKRLAYVLDAPIETLLTKE